MTIEEGLKLKPNFTIPYYGKRGVEIPGVGRDDFPQFFYNHGYRVGVEVGVHFGKFGLALCKAGLKVYGIDPYVNNYGSYIRPKAYQSHYEDATRNLKGYDYTIIKKFSTNALSDFKDGSLDFVYIDGNHTLPYAVMDIFVWEPKIRTGGIISGHDYAFIKGFREKKRPRVYDGVHVKAAVDACAYIMRVEKLYVLGKRYEKGRDKWRSWFWIKQ